MQAAFASCCYNYYSLSCSSSTRNLLKSEEKPGKNKITKKKTNNDKNRTAVTLANKSGKDKVLSKGKKLGKSNESKLVETSKDANSNKKSQKKASQVKQEERLG